MAETPSYYGPQPATENIDLTMYARIREEGFKHSHVMEFGGALADGIGPRLTGSPNMAKANAWTRDTLTKIGLENAHLEDWGEFGMGWQQINTWVRMVSPDPEPLWAQAAPWSPATNGPVTGEVVYMNVQEIRRSRKVQGYAEGQDRSARCDAPHARHHRAALSPLHRRRAEGDGNLSNQRGGRYTRARQSSQVLADRMKIAEIRKPP